VEVYRGGREEEGILLAKQGDEWTLPRRFGAKANVNKVRTLLTNLETLTGEIRSDSPDVLGDYGLEDSTAVHVVLKGESGDQLLHLLAGNRTKGSSVFLRFADSNEVLVGGQNLLGQFGIWSESNVDPDVASWLDLAAFSVGREDVQSLSIRGEGRTLALHKEFEATDDSTATPPTEYEWRVTQPKEFVAMKTRADGILSSLATIRARDVAPPPEEPAVYGLDEGADRVTITKNDETTVTLLFGDEVPDEEGQLYFMVEGEATAWKVPDYIKRNVFKDPKELEPN
jgi:hypothetical protein